MSCLRHELEVNKGKSLSKIKILSLRIEDCACPFCGENEIFAYPPSHRVGWWIIGCGSRFCDSVWRMQPDTAEKALKLLGNQT